MSSLQTIRFCNTCDNKLYHQVENDTLVYFCRICGEQTQIKDDVCVLNINYTNDSSKPIEHVINKYTKYDPSLPHILLHCPSDTCSSNKEGTNKQSDVIYIRYNNEQMKHVYMCTLCDYSWVSE